MRRCLFLFLLPFLLFSADYDCLFIGSSPIPLFEALYQWSTGKRVLILEGSCCLGGAWQSIDICGVQHADLGCHLIGNDQNVADFLETYGGCSIVSIDTPKTEGAQFGKNGFYFAHGCHELVHNLEKMISLSAIDLRLNQPAYSAVVDDLNQQVIVQTKDHLFTAKKIFITPYTRFCNEREATCNKAKFHHLYLLIQDPTPLDSPIAGASLIQRG